jgi:hypothetical protein
MKFLLFCLFKNWCGELLQFLRSVFHLLVTANVVLSSLILVTLMMETMPYSETYCHVYQVWVVWLITRRGFGLVTGFIRPGDYSCYTGYSYWGQLNTGSGSLYHSLTELYCTDVSLRGLTDEDWSLLLPETDWRRLTGVYCLPFLNSASNNGNTGLPIVGYHATQEYRSGERIHGNIAVT